MKKSIIENFTGGYSKSDVRLLNLTDTVNMYVESQGKGASASSIIRSIEGSEIYMKVSDSYCRGILVSSNGYYGTEMLFVVFGSILYCIYTDEIGERHIEEVLTLNDLTTPVTILENGGETVDTSWIFLIDGSQVYVIPKLVNPSEMHSGSFSADLPYRVNNSSTGGSDGKSYQRIVPTMGVYLYNYLLVNDSGTDAFYQTYQYPMEVSVSESDTSINTDIFQVRKGSTYEDIGFLTYAEWKPDPITAMCTNGTYLYTFGPKSTQIFTYQSDVDAPFTSPTNSANGIGIKAPYSLAINGDYIFYLGSSNIGDNGIFQWNSNTLTKISTPDIERKIKSLSNPIDAIGQVWTESGHMFYSISFIIDDITFVYDMLENCWHRRSTRDKNTNIGHYWRPQFATIFADPSTNHTNILFGTNDGYLIYLTNTKYTEYDGRPIVRTRRSGMLLDNYTPFLLSRIDVILNQGDVSDPNLTPKIGMRLSDNGGPWTNQRFSNMGKSGMYGKLASFYNLGIHRIVSIEISCSENMNFVILNGVISYSEVDRRI